MGVLGIGVDVVHVPRIAALIKRRTAQQLASRILSVEELVDYHAVKSDSRREVSFLAVRWSLKEAFYKAMFPRARPTWKELTYHRLDIQRRSKPYLEYHPSGAAQMNIGRIQCSVSHDGEYVFTSVLIEEPEKPDT